MADTSYSNTRFHLDHAYSAFLNACNEVQCQRRLREDGAGTEKAVRAAQDAADTARNRLARLIETLRDEVSR
jgi:hypothetical protein